MQFITTAVATVSLVALSGCATLEQISEEMQKANAQLGQATAPTQGGQASAPSMTDQSISQICKAADENKVRANSFYGGKGLSITAEVRSVNEGFKPRYRVYLTAGKVRVHAESNDLHAVSMLSSGNSVRVSGTVGDLDYDYQGCSITLKNANFQ